MEEEEKTTSADLDRRAGSPEAEEGKDERAEDSQRQADGQRSRIIPVTPHSHPATHRSAQGGEVLDLSAEGRNRDVGKIEY